MDDSLLQTVASNVGEEIEDVSAIIDEFCLQLHKELIEYKGMNGDYLMEELKHHISPQATYHLLGFLDTFSDKYNWEKGDAHEYLMRIGNRKHWLPYLHQMEDWKINKE
jgi:hypothetical protein